MENTLKTFLQLCRMSRLIDIGLLQASKVIAQLWKNMDVLSNGMWMKEVAVCLALERPTCFVRRKDESFARLWSAYVETHDFEF